MIVIEDNVFSSVYMCKNNTEMSAMSRLLRTHRKMSRAHKKMLIICGYLKEIHDGSAPRDIELAILKFYDTKLDSTILNETEIHYMYQHILPDIKDSDDFKLLLRASDDGFDSKTFHTLCDHKSPILTIVMSEEGDVFGGYSKLQWTQADKWKADRQEKESFIFVLRASNENKISQGVQAELPSVPFKWFVRNKYRGRALYDYHDGFGYGLDLIIGWDSDVKTGRAKQRLGHSYGPWNNYKSTMHFNHLTDYELWHIVSPENSVKQQQMQPR
eukprot:630479_1